MPGGAQSVLDERTLEASNANLLAVLSPGKSVLDVGCGSGAITQGIARAVGPQGHVWGVDRSEELIGEAQRQHGHLTNLTFECGDILDYPATPRFDIVTTARTLQWIAGPEVVVRHLAALLKPGGILCVLDYNHTRIAWDPQPPASMQYFYDAFLRWRSDAGMDNAIGDHIGNILEAEGLTVVLSEDRSEYTSREMASFSTHIRLWTTVAQTRGKQLVTDGYIGEAQRLDAIEAYTAWCATFAASMRLYLRATHATK